MKLYSMRTLALAGAMFAASSAVTGTEYFVDSQTGNDSNAGTDPQHAWKTIMRVNEQPLKGGDIVRFKKGCIFRKGGLQLASGEPGNPVLYTTYGEGTKPIIQPSLDYASAAKWEESAPGIWCTKNDFSWKVDESSPATDLRKTVWGVYSEHPSIVTCQTNENGEQNTVTIKCTRHGESTTNMQFIGPNLPKVTGHYCFTFRMRASRPFVMSPFLIMQAKTPWRNYNTEIGSMPSVTDTWKEFKVLLHRGESRIIPSEPIRLNNFMGRAIPNDTTVEFQPVSLQPAFFEGTMPLFSDIGNVIFNDGEFCGWKKWKVEDLTNERDYFHDKNNGILYMRHTGNPGNAYKSLELAPQRGCISHGGTSYATVDGLWLRYTGAHGFSGTGKGITIRNCDICYIGGSVLYVRGPIPTRYGNGIEFWSGSEDCLVENNRIWQCYDVAITNQGGGANTVHRNLIYRNNLLFNSEQSYEYWRSPESALTENVQFIGNTCLNAGFGWSHWQRPDKHACHLLAYNVTAKTRNVVIRDNVFYNARKAILCHHNDWLKFMTSDYNLWYQDDPKYDAVRVALANIKIPVAEFSVWQQKYGKDVHSVYAKPVFVKADFDHPENGDFRLAPNSPGYKGAQDGGPVGIRWTK